MIVILVVGIVLVFVSQSMGGEGGFQMKKRIFDLPDVEPIDQKGNFKRDFDVYFAAAADEFGVPFALLKAHAKMESDFNPRAFRDENPSKRTDRLGWASRGLMQLLFWPNSTRFKKYGFGPERNPEELFEPGLNTRIAAQLIRDNLNATKGSVIDAIDMYNDGNDYKKPAPYDYAKRVLSNYETLLGRKV